MELKSIAWYCFLATLLFEIISIPLQSAQSPSVEAAAPLPPADYDIRMDSFSHPLIIEYW